MILRKSAFQEGAFNLAGLLANVSAQNLTKPNIHRSAMMTNDDILEALSGLRILRNPKFFSSFETSTRTGLFAPVRTREEGFSDITTRGGNHSTGGSFRRSTRVREGEFSESIKKGSTYRSDHQQENQCYSPSVAAKSATGICTPNTLRATQTPKASFFVSSHYAHQISGLVRTVSMVALVGLRSRRPVSFVSGSANPANVTANHDICTSGGDSLNTKEAAAMLATIPTQNPQFIWLIAAVRRDMPTITAKIHHIAAESEREARRTLAQDHVCFFAGRIRLEVAA
ncbi:TPA: host cell division inhibitor Icd-like protein [Citrobacter braakii]|nr:host cell division inhibitor Icd-like protein [Citrobacter braakii]HCB1494749.1 host cell division inhibitor Icd-like protein [Citrobacter braakii]HCB1702011.1 host cell division inhibitor Icd-like protein [Citrobacter braakii]HCB1718642.1 host cell division inhibitor Icd-like protein [Citrobacter braakii]HCB1745521.1 host cell division inhibitor Icd-like protein [Citrobacter braakii]